MAALPRVCILGLLVSTLLAGGYAYQCKLAHYSQLIDFYQQAERQEQQGRLRERLLTPSQVEQREQEAFWYAMALSARVLRCSISPSRPPALAERELWKLWRLYAARTPVPDCTGLQTLGITIASD